VADFAVNIIVAAKDAASAVLKNVGASMAKMSGSVGGIGASMFNMAGGVGLATKMLGAFAVPLTGVAAIIAGTKFVLNTMKFTHELKELSYVFGESAEVIAKWQYITKIGGVDFEKFTLGINKMSDALGEAMLGKKDTVFEKLGLDIKQLAGMGTNQQLTTLARALDESGNSALRMKYAMDIWGKQAPQMVKLLRELSDAGGNSSGTLTEQEIYEGAIYEKKLAIAKEKATNLARKKALKGPGFFSDLWYGLTSPIGNPFSEGYWEDYYANRPSGEGGTVNREAESEVIKDHRMRRDSRKAALDQIEETKLKQLQEIKDKEFEKFKEEGFRVHESLRTPREITSDTQHQLMGLWAGGLISDEDFDRGFTKAMFGGKQLKENLGTAPEGFTLFESRTAGGIYRETPESRKMDRMIDLLAQIAAASKRGENDKQYVAERNLQELTLTNFR
jgi:hypothetical protein